MTQQITIKCTRDAGDKEAEPINDQMITTEPVAVSRGKRFLDDPDQGGYYRGVRHTLKVPYKGVLVMPGSWVEMTCPRINIDAQAVKVISNALSFDGNSFYASMTIERYEKNELV